MAVQDEINALPPERQELLALFREVTADSRDLRASLELLKSCSWDVDQALHLHLAEETSGAPARPSSAAPGSGNAGLGTPLLAEATTTPHAAARNTDTSRGGPGPGAGSPLLETSRYPYFSWVTRSVWRIGASVFSLICSFIFGPSGLRLGGAGSSGEAFGRALVSAYGSDGESMEMPKFFEGSFVQALQAARRDLKLLVVFIHSNSSRFGKKFCTEVLNNDLVRDMLDESFVVWGGDILRLETHQVAQMIHARQYPCFCALLPANMDEVRVVGEVHGDVQVDAAIALLTACLEEMDAHRAEIVARREQHAEDRSLREQQDREYQEALEVDRQRKEAQQQKDKEEYEAKRQAEEQLRREEEERQRLEQEAMALEESRRQRGASFQPEGPEDTARLAMRLPAGQRVQRKFRPTSTLEQVFAWAECCAYLPENASLGLQVPPKFSLRTSFPSRDLSEPELMQKTVQELQLVGANILLVEIEDDD